MVKLVRLQHLGVKSSVGRSLSRSAVRWEFVRIGDEGGGPSGHQMDRIHGGNISPARQFMRLRSGSVGSDTVRLGLPKKGTPADYLNSNTLYDTVSRHAAIQNATSYRLLPTRARRGGATPHTRDMDIHDTADISSSHNHD